MCYISKMDIRHLDLNLLVVLDALFDEGTVTGAAQRLGLSQPAVSFALNKLRRLFADDLFIRGAAGMMPTPRALGLREPVRRTIGIIRSEIMPAKGFDPAVGRHTFTLCLSDIGEMTFLPGLLARLRLIAPATSIVSVTMRPAELSVALEGGEVDLAVGYFPDLQTGIQQQALFEHPFVCLARRGNPLLADGLSLEAFLAADHLVVAQQGRSQEIFETALAARGLRRRVAVRTPHFMSAPLIIAGTDMLTTIPRAVGVVWARSLDLQLLPPPLDIPMIPLKQFWHRRFQAEARHRWLRELVASLYVGKDPTTPTEPDVIMEEHGGAG